MLLDMCGLNPHSLFSNASYPFGPSFPVRLLLTFLVQVEIFLHGELKVARHALTRSSPWVLRRRKESPVSSLHVCGFCDLLNIAEVTLWELPDPDHKRVHFLSPHSYQVAVGKEMREPCHEKAKPHAGSGPWDAGKEANCRAARC